MREEARKVTFAVLVLVHAIGEIIVAVVANMFSFHAYMLTFKLLPTFIAPKVSVLVVTVAYLLITFITVVLGYAFVSTVDDSVTTVAIVIFVLVYVVANEFSVTAVFVTVPVVIIVVAPGGNPYAATIAGVIAVIVHMIGVVWVFSALGFLMADVARCVLILVDMVVARKFSSAFIARPIAVGVYTNVRHPTATLVTEVVTVTVDMLLAKLLHTVSRVVALLTSSVIIPVEAIVAQPKIAIIAEVIVITIIVHKIVILITPVEIF